MKNIFKLFKNRKFILISVAFITIANLGFLAFGIKSYQDKNTNLTATPIANAVKPKIDIKNVETTELTSDKIGNKLGEGDYKFETLSKSKIKTGTAAELVIAANEKSGGHFVLAFIGAKSKPAPQQLNPNWSLTTIAKDPMWAPGACSSKPSFLLQGKYIYIDDGKTDPKDKNNSYIVFNMQTGKYVYFGGSNFSKEQGNNERILKSVNENDKLVFYIDIPDTKKAIKNSNGDFIHIHGSEKGYIIRREIDPQTLHYIDYSLPYESPAKPTKYVLAGSWDNIFQLDSLDPNQSFWYTGKVKNGAISLSRHSFDDTSGGENDVISETSLELKLSSQLKTQLPVLYKQKPYAGSVFKTNLAIIELGTYNNLKFLTISQRYETYETPAIYDKNTNEVITLTNQKILQGYSTYVDLGVF